MSAKPNEGNPESEGDANANSTSSTQQSQPLEANFAGLIAGLQKQIDAQDGEIRALKSGKDKAVDRVVKSQEETLAKLAQYLGVDETKVREAQRQSVLDDLIAERTGRVQPEQTIHGRVESQGNTPELQIDVENVVKAMDFPENDVAVAAVKKEYFDNPSTLISELAKLKITQASVKPAGPAGALPPSDGRSGSSQKSEAQLKTEYEKARDQIAQTQRGDAKVRMLSDLKVRYREAGLKI